ncbi:toll/interleukin-1 receptor domain-containing protein [Leptolyngbya cf. ectocarpi LEGE 11479]|uniref:Toll/interleukin-1 receptor domain-containing protein n=1 Tax=Leptolyngbya cf. ectocarpi LEGE 11479 TaxID=1828722 RepID=A0A929FBK8_LEPEC|nr:toll/interleukin-1 receptor domain-containing protein [Leptolyngbya ectocarpi]MBE9069217.1 toll/interleukin-1 receptor domain-containing protein [Leptolyngbya cf. ectocarpi LEGE 11479]
MTQAIDVFVSYSSKDEELKDELLNHLALLKRKKIISAWHSREILPGADWLGVVDEHIESAQIILLLISADFLASDYCYEVEMKRAMKLHDLKKAIVIPVILKPTDWQDSPFGKLEPLPRFAEPVILWRHRDEAFSSIANSLGELVDNLIKNYQS